MHWKSRPRAGISANRAVRWRQGIPITDQGMSDYDFSKNKDDRKSVSGMVTFLNGSVVAFKSNT